MLNFEKRLIQQLKFWKTNLISSYLVINLFLNNLWGQIKFLNISNYIWVDKNQIKVIYLKRY